MNLAEIIDAARRQLDDVEGGAARLFSDAELAYFANSAQDRICETVLPIEDSTTETDVNNVPVCVIPVIAGTSTYSLHPKILQVIRVKYDGRDYPLREMSTVTLDMNHPGWQTDTGEPDGYVLDQNTWSLILNRIPEESSNLRLIVKRMPLNPLSPNNLTSSPEIPSVYHEKMMDWILYMAYMKQDVETFDRTKSQIYLTLFNANLEMIRRMQIRRKQRTIYSLRSYY